MTPVVAQQMSAQMFPPTDGLKPEDDPSNPSSDYLAMAPDWDMITDIRNGARAIKLQTTKYLPKYEKETDKAYILRLESTPWRPEFVDALQGTCSKPFTKPVSLQGDIPEQIKTLAEDIDGEGNDLHSFAREAFLNGVAMGLEAIYVTYPDVDPDLTLAEEKKAGARPYWVHISARDLIACHTRKIGGRDVIDDVRFRETRTVNVGFAEKITECIRHIHLADSGKPEWQLYEKQVDQHVPTKIRWVIIAEGALTVDDIPIVLYFTGQRSGTYRVKSPMGDLAHMQLEIYRALSREDEIYTYAGSPMLKGVGMNAPAPQQDLAIAGRDYPNHGVRAVPAEPLSQITIGPKTILFAPPGIDGKTADWDFIQPHAANLVAVSANVNDKIHHFRRLALQPLTPESGRLTATSSAIDAAKAHSAVECWAIGLKDALEQALVFTAQWLRIETTAEVSVHTDFGVDIEGFDEFVNITNMRASGDLSRETLWDEASRRGILGPQFDPEKEAELVQAESDKEAEEDINQQVDKATDLARVPSLPGSGVTA